MCGIVGIVRPGSVRAMDRAAIETGLRALISRGPDGQGAWIGSSAILGATRLAIRGGEAGAQPLSSGIGRRAQAVLVFNGEIYSHRTGNGDHESITGSDTAWLEGRLADSGVELLSEIDGMFALAHWNPTRRRLLLARDRWGEKPLYWAALRDGGLAFASVPSALLSFAEVDASLDEIRVTQFLKHSYWSGPGRTPWKGVNLLPPGGALEWLDGKLAEWLWWTPEPSGFARAGARADAGVLDGLLRTAVERRLTGDQPIGALLSGGLDSSLIVAVAKQLGRPLPVWTVRWQEEGWDESEHAREVSHHLGLDQHWVDVEASDLPRRLGTLVAAFGEPFADESLLPTSLVVEAASASVRVVLTGDGGDELFGGYERYTWPGDGQRDYSDVFSACPSTLLEQLVVPDLRPVAERPREGCSRGPSPSCSERDRRRWLDLQSYLPDDLLRKVDRAAGRVGVENRAPYLDSELSQWAMGLQSKALWRDGLGKAPLRDVGERYLPSRINRRAKKGFGVPLSLWFRGALQVWVTERLMSGTLDRTGWFRSGSLERLLNQHLAGAERSRVLFNLVVLAEWLEQQASGICEQGASAPSGSHV